MFLRPSRIPGMSVLACLCAALVPAAAPAASEGGASAEARTVGEPPRPGAVTCRTGCSALDGARTGSRVQVRGERLQDVTAVRFLGAPGAQDDVDAPVAVATGRTAEAVVPASAATGPVAVLGAGPARQARRALRIGDPAAPAMQTALSARKVYYGSGRDATLDVFVPAGVPRNVSVDVVRVADGTPVARIDTDAVAPETVVSVTWRGRALGGRVAPEGRYAFRLVGPETVPDAQFTFLGHQFPIRGKHSYGEGAARYGAGRGGGSHTGEDVFADCGTPLVAARGGQVEFAGFQGRAGNYVVIDGEGTGLDYAYMHLGAVPLVQTGDTVATGEPIGEVGDTGSASACHLHFELWSAPGWYAGGSTVDPLRQLQAWDAASGVHTPESVRRAVTARTG